MANYNAQDLFAEGAVFESLNDLPQDFTALGECISAVLQEKPTTLKRLVSSECQEIQRNEMLALKAIFEEDLDVVDEDCKCFKILISEKCEDVAEDQIIEIWFSVPVNYPNEIPICEVEGHGGMSFDKADQLYEILLEEAFKRLHETMIYDLVMVAREFISAHVIRKADEATLKPGEVDQENTYTETEDAKHEEKDRRNFYLGPPSLRPTKYTGPIHKVLKSIPKTLQVVSLLQLTLNSRGKNILELRKKWRERSVDQVFLFCLWFIWSINQMFSNEKEMNLRTFGTLGRSTKIENILRDDLAQKFDKCNDKFQEEYQDKARRWPERFLLQPCLGFHGTAALNVKSIVRTGLKVPGRESGVAVAHGSAYGVGIYLSPNPSFSLGYACEMRTLLVCSVLLGDCLKLGPSAKTCDPRKSDSVINENGDIMVIFNAAQVLPCFVMRFAYKHPDAEELDLHQIAGAYATRIVKVKQTEESPLERKDRIKRRAQKFLPHGYGPSNKILDVASSDDDEEDYGEYQKYRYESNDAEDLDGFGTYSSF